MPINDRLTFSFRIALACFVGFATGMSILAGVDFFLNEQSGDASKIQPSELLIIYAIFISVLAFIDAAGSFLSSMFLPMSVRSWCFWLLAGLLGMMSAVGMIALVFWVEIDLLTLHGLGGLFLSGVLLGVVLRLVGFGLGWAHHWYPKGMCQACGYDLRETKVGDGCPECGQIKPSPLVKQT